jgi:hypothetical protein
MVQILSSELASVLGSLQPEFMILELLDLPLSDHEPSISIDTI